MCHWHCVQALDCPSPQKSADLLHLHLMRICLESLLDDATAGDHVAYMVHLWGLYLGAFVKCAFCSMLVGVCCLQAGLLYRAIKLWIRLHKWQRALQLAHKHQQHVDTVLMYRRR